LSVCDTVESLEQNRLTDSNTLNTSVDSARLLMSIHKERCIKPV